LQSFWNRYYKPRNAILALSRAVEPAAVREWITAHFAKLAPGEPIPAPREPGPAKLRPPELMMARQQIGPLLGLVDLPDNILTNNPYGVAFSLGRREQLNMSSAELRRAWDAVTDEQLLEVAKKVFAPDRHAGAFIAVEK
jgi:predicted Zn-dependent peptidase